MVTSRRNTSPPAIPHRRPPATTTEARENQLIAKAVDLVERQIEEGTASSQVLTHYLKLGSTREKLEHEKLIQENELLKAKVESIASGKRVEDLYDKAIKAMRGYAGQDEDEGDGYED